MLLRLSFSRVAVKINVQACILTQNRDPTSTLAMPLLHLVIPTSTRVLTFFEFVRVYTIYWLQTIAKTSCKKIQNINFLGGAKPTFDTTRKLLQIESRVWCQTM